MKECSTGYGFWHCTRCTSDAIDLKVVFHILLYSTLLVPGLSQNTLSSEAAVSAALQNHPSLKAAAFEVQAKKHGEKAAINIPNPELNLESPTGEFYTFGVSQSFDFPTVYLRQKQVAIAETRLAQAGQLMAENDLRFLVKMLYLDAQVADYQWLQWARRDSLYREISAAAGRQFAAGEIDFLQKNLTESEAGDIHQQSLAAFQTAAASREWLAAITGLQPSVHFPALQPDTVDLAAVPSLVGNPSFLMDQRTQLVAEKQVELAKSRALPNFSLGYMNQGIRSTPIDYRFKASLGVPLWAGQYRAGVQAASAEAQAARSRVSAKELEITVAYKKAHTEALTAWGQLQYLEQEALPRAQALISAALRMREAGQIDYPTFLRTLQQAFGTENDYLAQLKAFNTAVLQMRYLSGQ